MGLIRHKFSSADSSPAIIGAWEPVSNIIVIWITRDMDYVIFIIEQQNLMC